MIETALQEGWELDKSAQLFHPGDEATKVETEMLQSLSMEAVQFCFL